MGLGIKIEHNTCAAHRLLGHEGECRNLHGHNYRWILHFSGSHTDSVGRLVDFSVLKSTCKGYLDNMFDHRTLLCAGDPLIEVLEKMEQPVTILEANATAENMATFVLHDLQNVLKEAIAALVEYCEIENTNIKLTKVEVYETSTNSAVAYEDI